MHLAYCHGVAGAPWQGPGRRIACNQEAHISNRAKASIGRCAVTKRLQIQPLSIYKISHEINRQVAHRQVF